jgi:hypothetical protein
VNRIEAVAVRAGISDGAYTAVQAVGGAALSEGDQVVIGMLHPELAGKPSVSLGQR